MNENTERENPINARKEQALKRVEQQITKLAALIEELLADVKMSELTSRERLLIAARFTSLHQRAILLNSTLDKTQAENAQDTALALMMRGIREEYEKERLRVIDSQVSVFQSIDDHRLDDEMSESEE